MTEEITLYNRSKRNSALELLRIIAMMAIVFYHYNVHGVVTDPVNIVPLKYVRDMFMICGALGNDIFVLISGYFMVTSRIRLKKIFRVYAEVFFYSFAILLLFLFILPFPTMEPVEALKAVIRSIIPIEYSNTWFATAYVGLMIISPLLNKFIKSISKSTYQKTLIVLFIIFSFVQTFLPSSGYGNGNMGWFIFLYLVSGYVRLYGNEMKKHNHVFGIIFFATLLVLSSVTLNFLAQLTGLEIIGSHTTYFYKNSCLLEFGLALEIVLFFIDLKPFISKPINLIASATFGVYLIHDNPLMRPYLWKSIFQNQLFYVGGGLDIPAPYGRDSRLCLCDVHSYRPV